MVLAKLPAVALEQNVDAPIPIAHSRARDLVHPATQIVPPVFDAAVVLHTARLLDQSAGPPHVEGIVAHDVLHCMPL